MSEMLIECNHLLLKGAAEDRP